MYWLIYLCRVDSFGWTVFSIVLTARGAIRQLIMGRAGGGNFFLENERAKHCMLRGQQGVSRPRVLSNRGINRGVRSRGAVNLRLFIRRSGGEGGGANLFISVFTINRVEHGPTRVDGRIASKPRHVW